MMTANIMSRARVGLFAPCNTAAEIMITSIEIADSVRIIVP